jgi:hypothetical protein
MSEHRPPKPDWLREMERYERESLRRLKKMEEFICGPATELPSEEIGDEFAEMQRQQAIDVLCLEEGGLSVEDLFQVHQRQIAALEWALRTKIRPERKEWFEAELEKAYVEEEYLEKLLRKRKVAS